MSGLVLSALFVAAAAAAAFAGAMAVVSTDDDDLRYTAHVLLVAADAWATPTTDPATAPDPASYALLGGCVRAPGFTYTINGFEVEGAVADFYYSHLFVIESTEPFTHPPVAIQGSGPDGFAVQVAGEATSGTADIAVPLPAAPGLYTFELQPSPGVVVTGPPVTFMLPPDCSPFALSDWSPPLIDAVFPLQFTANPTWHGGNCPGFTTLLQITVNDDGAVTFFQPDTLDLNTGALWPAPGGGFEFLVRNDAHPEAYGGTFAPGFTSFSGNTVWNNQCLWSIDGILDD